MHSRKAFLLAALAALNVFASQARAQGPDPFGGKLFPPDFIMNNADAIGLSQDQRESIRDLVQGIQGRFAELQQQLKAEVEALAKVAEPANADQSAVLAQFDKVADREKEIKRAQLSMLLEIRKKLTDDQRAKLAQMRPEKPQNFPPPELREKMERVKAAATKWQSEGRDVAPVAQMMQQLDPLLRAGKMQEAGALLDEALKTLEGK
jgi:Spy/CpxP family protein refolding chaperone